MFIGYERLSFYHADSIVALGVDTSFPSLLGFEKRDIGVLLFL
ncbi:hypothetical protein ACQKKK_13300 [Peribacillus sp. NPDC006672]